MLTGYRLMAYIGPVSDWTPAFTLAHLPTNGAAPPGGTLVRGNTAGEPCCVFATVEAAAKWVKANQGFLVWDVSRQFPFA